MTNHVADDLAVVINDKRHRYAIGEGEDRGHEVSSLHCVREVVEGATREETFGHKATPDMHQRHQRPRDGIRPD